MSLVNRNRKSGFTLVEIMIVVLIIGILLAIAVPNFVKARESSRTKSCIANMKQLESGAAQWAMDNKKAPGAAVTVANLVGTTAADSYIRTAPLCPAGTGSYADWTIDTRPLCPNVGANATHVLP